MKKIFQAGALAAAFLIAGGMSGMAVKSYAGPVYSPEQYPEGVLRTMTLSMSSTERLAWYLDETGRTPDETIRQAQEGTNEEIAALLNVGGEIERWVTQADNNDYYLTHNAWRGEDVNGAVFFDSRCCYFPQDDHVILHGHNMKGGAVFGALNNYRDLNYLRNHPLITLRTLEGESVYAIYAVTDVNVDINADNYFPEIRWSFDPDGFRIYTGYLIDHSYFTVPVDLVYGDRLLTLSTCSYVYSDSRLLICARKLRGSETPEEMAGLIAASEDSGVGLDDTKFVYAGGGDYETLLPESDAGAEQGDFAEIIIDPE